ncbi:MAG: tetratricopeptide repeat protein, partial [bacterium]
KYHHKYFSLTAALTKCEHFWSPDPYSPRLTFALETNNRFMLERPEVGSIECIVQDNSTKGLVPNAIIDVKEINKRYKAQAGTFDLSLPAGTYTVSVLKTDYQDYMAKITVKSGVKSKLVFNLKKTQEALAQGLALQEKQKKISTLLQQGKIYYSEGNLNDAKLSFQKILELEPAHDEASSYLGKIEPRRAELIAAYSAEARSRAKAKDLTKAMELWKQVLVLDHNDAEATSELAKIQKQIADAKKPVKPKQPTKPKEPKVTQAQIDALYKKGVTYFTTEKYDDALKVFKQVLALDPNHAGAKDYKKRTEARIKVLKGGG